MGQAHCAICHYKDDKIKMTLHNSRASKIVGQGEDQEKMISDSKLEQTGDSELNKSNVSREENQEKRRTKSMKE